MIKKILIDRGIVELDNKWKVGQKSIGFKISDKFTEFTKLKITNPKFVVRLERIERSRQDYSSPLANHFRKWLSLIEVIESNRLMELSNIKSDSELECFNCSIRKLVDKEFAVSNRDKNGRIYHNLTNCPKEIRNCLSINNEKLIEVDVCNAHPLLLLTLIKSYKNTPIPFQYHNEVQKYKELVESGKLYSLFEDWGFTRESSKHQFISNVLYGKTLHGSKLKVMFNKEFPFVAGFIDDIKKDDYCRLANELMKLESKIVVDTVAIELMNSFPNVPVITVHDSIMTTSRNAGLVERLIKKAFEAFGVSPAVRCK